MSDETVDYFCSGSVLTALPCGKPAARVRVTPPGTPRSHIDYLCLDHQGQARSAGWTVTAEPRSISPEF
jgi:hypothetical protein